MIDIVDFVIKNKEWIFSGIGVTLLGLVFTKNVKEKQNVVKDDHSVNFNNCTIADRITNNYGADEKGVKGWFSERVDTVCNALNLTKEFRENEYTIEYISHLLDVDSNTMKKFYVDGFEPDDLVKEKFVNTFGVNRDWFYWGRGENPFRSNIDFWGNDPMDILRKTDLSKIKKFILVVGEFDHRNHIVVMRKTEDYCYEIYPKPFIYHSDVGNTGAARLTSLYRFIRESDKLGKLEPYAYSATEQQMQDLLDGRIYPKEVLKYPILRNFVDDFLNLASSDFSDDMFCKVKEIISDRIKEQDRINQENDIFLINKMMRG